MRFFITGATGFIGRHLCHALCDAGHEVTALVRSADKASTLPDAARRHMGDLSIFSRADSVLPEVDVVVHLAGVVAADTPAQYDQINHQAVKDLIDCLERQAWTPRRLLFASSLAAAGPSPGTEPWTENDPLAPIDPYGAAKARAETLVEKTTFPATTFRPCIVLGPDDPASLTLFRAARSGVGMRVAGDPQRLSFIDVRDVVSAIVCMAQDEREGRFTYYVSHPDATDVRELWHALSDAVGNRVRVVPVPKVVLYAAMRVATLASRVIGLRNQLDVKQYAQMVAPAFVCSSAALGQDLGWKPQHALGEACRHAAAGYRRSGQLGA